MPTYVKSPTMSAIEKSAEGEAKTMTQSAENTVQDLVDENGQCSSPLIPVMKFMNVTMSLTHIFSQPILPSRTCDMVSQPVLAQ